MFLEFRFCVCLYLVWAGPPLPITQQTWFNIFKHDNNLYRTSSLLHAKRFNNMLSEKKINTWPESIESECHNNYEPILCKSFLSCICSLFLPFIFIFLKKWHLVASHTYPSFSGPNRLWKISPCRWTQSNRLINLYHRTWNLKHRKIGTNHTLANHNN